MDRIEEMHSRHPRGIHRFRGYFTDRDRGGVRGKDGVSRHDALPLLEDRALDGELFHDRFDRDFAASEAAVVEAPGEKRHLGRHVPGREATLADLLLPDGRGGGEAVRERLRVDVFHPGGQTLVRRELSDPAPHHARSQNSDARHRPRAGVRIRGARLFFDLFGREKEKEQILLDLAAEDPGDVARFGVEADLD